MSEIKTKPYRIRPVQTIAVLPEGIIKVEDEETALFTAEHTISDILRYAIDQSDLEEVEALIQLMKENQWETE
jgi:uncharacterized membrane protein YvbJ